MIEGENLDSLERPKAKGLAGRLQREFDASFQHPPADAGAERRDFVLVEAGGMRLALPVQALKGIEHGGTLVEVPSRAAGMVGLVGVRSAAVAVFSLCTLLGGAGANERRLEARAGVCAGGRGRGGGAGVGI